MHHTLQRVEMTKLGVSKIIFGILRSYYSEFQVGSTISMSFNVYIFISLTFSRVVRLVIFSTYVRVFIYILRMYVNCT